MFTVNKMKSSEFLLVALTLSLTIFGIIMVFSASYYLSINNWGDPYYFLRRHIIWALLGLVLMIATTMINYRIYAKLAPVILMGGLVLLGLIFTPLGVEVNHATRWIGIGANNQFTIMPGEVIKIALIIFVAWYLSKDPTRAKSLVRGFLPMVALAGICAVMLVLQPALSTAITVVGIVIGILFVAGLNPLVILGLVGASGAGVYVFITADPTMYWYRRLTSFMDPFADPLNTGYQAVQSLLALGSGGVTGLGLGQGIQKSLYLPEPHNDFIFAIVGEELGFIGCLLLITMYILVIWRGTSIAINAPDLFGTLVAFGITIMLAIQVIFNVAVVTSSMPPTGVTLPFLSFGGNALLLFMGSMGILLNISKQSTRQNNSYQAETEPVA